MMNQELHHASLNTFRAERTIHVPVPDGVSHGRPSKSFGMTPERAREIWDSRSPFGEVQVTPIEKAYINAIWRRMPGHCCWAEALLAIANGQHPLCLALTRGSVL